MAYDVLQDYIGIPEFSLYPEDDGKTDNKIDPEDYEDIITKIFDKLQLTFPEQEQYDYLNKQYERRMKVEYVRELLKIKIYPNLNEAMEIDETDEKLNVSTEK